MRKPIEAFNRVELIVVIGIVALISAISLSAVSRSGPQVQRLACSNNLKQVGLAFRTWAIDHNGNTPMSLSQSQGGDSEDVGHRVLGADQQSSVGVSKMFLCMSNELITPKILFCPAEYENTYRQAATNFAGVPAPGTVPYINDLNASYFIGVDAQETSPRLFLTGDHNIGGDGNPPSTAFCAAPAVYSPAGYAVWLGTNWNVNQGPAFMANQHDKQGNIGFADGSVEWFDLRSVFTYLRLQAALKSSGDTGRAPGTNFKPATGIGPLPGPGCNRIQLP